VLDRGYVEKSTKAVTTTISVKGLTVSPGGTVKSTKTSQKVSSVEKGKLVSTALGRTVIEWLLKTFDDLLAYDFTARMELQLDKVAAGICVWKDPLNQTWSVYKDRYQEIMQESGSGSSKGTLGSDEAGLYKILVSKKGPLFVLEKEGEKTRFASVPSTLSVQKATLEDAKAAFTVLAPTTLTILDGLPVIQKSGKVGPYLSWNGVSVPLKEETLADSETRLREKLTAIDHTVGPFKIKKGQYGLYMYRVGTGKPTFVGLPEGTDYASLTVEGAEALYKANSKKKSKIV
jgi:DNA topoisomerase-1